MERFVFLSIFWLVVLFISVTFRVSLPVIFVPVLIVVLIIAISKIIWYNRKTKVIDWVEVVLCLAVLIVALFLFFKENKLENAVQEAMKGNGGSEDSTIEYIDEVEYKENHIVVGYTMKDEHTKYLEWFYCRDGELVRDAKREIIVD